MDRFPADAPGLMPMGSFQRPGGLPWIPWRWIRKRYSPGAWKELTHLFNAYNLIHSRINIEGIRSELPACNIEDPCRRCGQCCAQLIPDPVPVETVHGWAEKGNPVHLFLAPVTEGPRAGRFYTGWYHNGARLRMCPLLLRDPESGSNFCALYHLGPGYRPQACEEYKPNWPHCEVSQRPLVP
jgi:hypothetical protein